jgi:hypothetical protein
MTTPESGRLLGKTLGIISVLKTGKDEVRSS